MIKKGVSLVGIDSRSQLISLIKKYDEINFELSYNTSNIFLKENIDLLSGRVASVHSLSPEREYFPNFASFDKKVIDWSLDELKKDAALAKSLGAKYIILHPGYITNLLVPSDANKRLSIFSKGMCTRDYFYKDEYKKYISNMFLNIENASSIMKDEFDITLLIENLNPRFGYLFITPNEMMDQKLNIFYCLDIGHMYITTLLLGLDFYTSIKSILDTNKVKSIHIHSNPSRVDNYVDTHERASKYLKKFDKLKELFNQYDSNQIIESLYEIDDAYSEIC